VLVTARRFRDLSVTDDPLPAPRQVEATARAVASHEPHDELHAADPPTDEIQDLLGGQPGTAPSDGSPARRAQGA
jgi:DNA recombination protein RmuC